MAQTHQQLLQKLSSLSKTFPNLGTRLFQAATDLQKTGTPPSESLLKEVTAYSHDFASLRDQGLQLAKYSQISPEAIISLDDIENLLKTPTSPREDIRQQALTVLNRVLAIAHIDFSTQQSNFPPLESVQIKARELQQAISNSPPNQLHPEAQPLTDGTHPLTAVLKLIEQQEDLDDDQWLTLEEIAIANFDKKLVVAISRGKLTISQNKLPVSAQPAAPKIKLPSLEDLEKPEAASQSPPSISPSFAGAGGNQSVEKTTAEELPPLIIVPPGGGAGDRTVVTEDPDIMILEDPTPSPLDEVIIVPGLQVSQPSQPSQLPQPSQSVERQNAIFGQQSQTSIGLKVLVHLQGIGDRSFGASEYAGTRGQGLRVEAFQINIDPPIPGLTLQYMAHISSLGDTPWLDEGKLAGERGRSFRLEGFAIRLAGLEAAKYEVFYTAHIQNLGDTPVYPNGQYCGTRGRELRVEGMKVWIQPRRF